MKLLVVTLSIAIVAFIISLIALWNIPGKSKFPSSISLNDYTVDIDGVEASENNKYYTMVELLPNVMNTKHKQEKLAYTWHFVAYSEEAFNKITFNFKNTDWQKQFTFEDPAESPTSDEKYEYKYNKENASMEISVKQDEDNKQKKDNEQKTNFIDVYINDWWHSFGQMLNTL